MLHTLLTVMAAGVVDDAPANTFGLPWATAGCRSDVDAPGEMGDSVGRRWRRQQQQLLLMLFVVGWNKRAAGGSGGDGW